MVVMLFAALMSFGTPADPPSVAWTEEPMSAQRGFFGAVSGEWQGEGELFGNTTQFTMNWRADLGGRFMTLEYSIVGVMDAIAHYRMAESGVALGTWVDSRGEILELEGEVSRTTLDTIWRSPSETGRTVYELEDENTLVVQDYVQEADGWRLFGEARYVRSSD